MPVYRVFPGYDQDLVELLPITPQPTADPVAPVERGFGNSGTVHDQGGFLKLHWDHVEDEDEYLALLTQFGLHIADSAEVTIYCRGPRLIWARYNGIAQLPEPSVDIKQQNFFLRDIDMYITDLEDIS